VTSRPVVCAE